MILIIIYPLILFLLQPKSTVQVRNTWSWFSDGKGWRAQLFFFFHFYPAGSYKLFSWIISLKLVSTVTNSGRISTSEQIDTIVILSFTKFCCSVYSALLQFISWCFYLLHSTTGSKQHDTEIRTQRAQQHWHCSQHWVSPASSQTVSHFPHLLYPLWFSSTEFQCISFSRKYFPGIHRIQQWSVGY